MKDSAVGVAVDTLKLGWPLSTSTANLTAMQALNLDYVALGVILAVVLFFLGRKNCGRT
jgi:hypothetical protein